MEDGCRDYGSPACRPHEAALLRAVARLGGDTGDPARSPVDLPIARRGWQERPSLSESMTS